MPGIHTTQRLFLILAISALPKKAGEYFGSITIILVVATKARTGWPAAMAGPPGERGSGRRGISLRPLTAKILDKFSFRRRGSTQGGGRSTGDGSIMRMEAEESVHELPTGATGLSSRRFTRGDSATERAGEVASTSEVVRGASSSSSSRSPARPRDRLFNRGDSAQEGRARSGGKKSDQRFRDVYRVCRTVGNGAFSCVRIVEKRSPGPSGAAGERWACKTLQLPPPGHDVVEGQSTVEDVENEIAVLSALSHPAIIALHEYFVEDGTIHLIMELLAGGELLDALVDRGCFPEEDVREIFKDLLDAVAYLHAEGLAHRDLKLENLIIVNPDVSTKVKIVDFGLAKSLVDDHFKTICGTPLYLAPEVITPTGYRGPDMRTSTYGLKCDEWACGVILYMLLSGHPPFHSTSMPEMFDIIRRGQLQFRDPIWDLCSDEAKNLIQLLLTVDPAERITAAQALEHPWFTMNL